MCVCVCHILSPLHIGGVFEHSVCTCLHCMQYEFLTENYKNMSTCPSINGTTLIFQLKSIVTFEDVLAEPASVRSFDKVWLWSHALFEVSRLWFYRIVSLLLAVPVALTAGLLFAVLSCLHIWLIVPSVQLLVINLHWIKVVWHNVLNIAIFPFFRSFGKCCGFIRISLEKY
uniref:Caveolin n=1 Tax=Sinocyclocheilus anshuiensis TaxID=1608454 RepID=A0A671Q965_9TELE